MNKQKNVVGKQAKLLILLALLVVGSLFGGTLSVYSTKVVDDGGSIRPKYYAFELSASVTDQTVAPGDSVTYYYYVSNFNSGGTAEIDLKTYATLYFPTSLAGTGRVLAQLYCNDQLLGSSDTGTLYCDGVTLPKNVQTTDTYTLTLSWQDADLAYLGQNTWQTFDSSQVHINMAGYQ